MSKCSNSFIHIIFYFWTNMIYYKTTKGSENFNLYWVADRIIVMSSHVYYINQCCSFKGVGGWYNIFLPLNFSLAVLSCYIPLIIVHMSLEGFKSGPILWYMLFPTNEFEFMVWWHIPHKTFTHILILIISSFLFHV